MGACSASGHGHVGLLHAGHVEGDQRIAVEVGVDRDADRFFHTWGLRLFVGTAGDEKKSRAAPPDTGALLLLNFMSPVCGYGL